ncbi:MAG: methyltransferase domain-containing protein [archaeon]
MRRKAPQVLVVFTVSRRTLEQALEYLVCPADYSELTLDTERSDLVSDGAFVCTTCGKTYEIKNGVPYFFEKGNGFEWRETSFVSSIAETLGDRDLTWSKILSLSGSFLSSFGNRKRAIDEIFDMIEKVIETTEVEDEVAAYLMQAGTAARYDIETYRGTFLLPRDILAFLATRFSGTGILVEGACATGECLVEIAGELNSEFYLGLDISGGMVRQAQQIASPKMLFVQGDIRFLPLRQSSAGVYVMNNVFDRVVDPPKASREANRILDNTRSLFVPSNCDPLQYAYGDDIVWVPPEKQISLEQGLELAGFRKMMETRDVWNIETAAYGKEALPTISLVGGRK